MKRIAVAVLGLALAFAWVSASPVWAQTEEEPRDGEKKQTPGPDELRNRLIEQGLEQWKSMSEAEKKRLLETAQDLFGLGGIPKEESKKVLENARKALETGVERWAKMTDEERRRTLEQAQDLWNDLSPEERRKMLENFAREGARALEDLGRRPEDDEKKEDKKKDEGPKIPEWAEELRQYAEEAERLYDAWQNMPEESRQQLIADVLEGLKIYYEDNIRPELEREAARLQEEARKAASELEKFRNLPKEEQRKILRDLAREARREFFGDGGGERPDHAHPEPGEPAPGEKKKEEY
ncbi:MAG: DUF3106 domain-containing protein [Planctomycetes bacterium]|nr:DUF3106 domain-containing protein [Planctomycetota bacterium]